MHHSEQCCTFQPFWKKVQENAHGRAVIVKYRATTQTAGCYVIPNAWLMMSQLSWHVYNLVEHIDYRNHKCRIFNYDPYAAFWDRGR
jgi:hypothetical protein